MDAGARQGMNYCWRNPRAKNRAREENAHKGKNLVELRSSSNRKNILAGKKREHVIKASAD
jgi:hypothetical protein